MPLSGATRSRNARVIIVHIEKAFFTVRTPLVAQLEGVRNVARRTFWALRCWRPRIHIELLAANEAEMRGVVPNTHCEAFVVRVVRILLAVRLIDIVRITVRPRLNSATAGVTHESNTLCH